MLRLVLDWALDWFRANSDLVVGLVQDMLDQFLTGLGMVQTWFKAYFKLMLN